MNDISDPITWPDVVQVASGLVDVQLGSAIRVEFRAGVVPYRWNVVSAEDPSDVVLQVDGSLDSVLVPPGTYRVTTQMENGGESVLSSDALVVAAGQVVVVRP